MCQEHGKELALRCITDEKEVCVGCIMNAHSGHQIEGIHKREQKRLNDYWKSQNTELEVRVPLNSHHVTEFNDERPFLHFLRNSLLRFSKHPVY